ncbi:helix-turn-helix transcriptional regulator [Jiella sp. M17.18]|uniref:helix-turn-helix transcriptional regulator n=1 Tax=Jiella sp. M17.18 TaxID=3234247 RepID=UPI0034DE6654
MLDRQSSLTQAIDRLYRTLDGETDWNDALGRCAEAVGAERFNILILGRDGSIHHETFPFHPEGAIDYVTNYADKDVRVPRALARPSGLIETYDLMSEDEVKTCPVHQEFYRAHPECWNTLMAVNRSAEAIIAPVAHRSARHGAFAPEERRALAVVAGHVVRVAQLRQMIVPSVLSSDGTLAVLDSLDEALVLFDDAGRVCHVNPRAAALIDRGDALVLRGGVLAARDPVAAGALVRAMGQAVLFLAGRGLALPEPVAVPRGLERSPLLVRFFAAPAGERGGPNCGVLRIADPDAARLPSIATIRLATGLTQAESALALAIFRGLTIREFADQSGLSEQTLRSRLKRICEKLGVRRQVEIATRIAAIARA